MRQENVAQFGDMISCVTDRGLIRSWADYDGYGCYCGLGGSGSPLDETDGCCLRHDNCYGEVMTSGLCPSENFVYIVSYEYISRYCRTAQATLYCRTAEEYGFFDGLYPECAAAMCKCDMEGACALQRPLTTRISKVILKTRVEKQTQHE
ncbi:putative phospholipase A2 AP-PLA2-I [Apostichopus japonicus]|uniref:Phospholipase A2 n=1 Tax=Stichopus japonicus TaxID=307972 RepID=A0A2G8JEC3_STIJA|nr:putative phospholipase A2 AP-PLA2-I [Apostichopus japonicus]